MACPAMDNRTLPVTRPEPRPELSKGIYLKRVEYLDGRVSEETLAEVHGVKNPFKHYEIWREIAVPGRSKQPRTQESPSMGRPSTEPPKGMPFPTTATPFPVTTGTPLALNQLLRIEATRTQSIGATLLPPIHLTLAIKDSRQLPEAMQTVRIAQQTILKGREVTIDRVFLVSNPQKIDEQRTLLAEIIPTSELIELRKLVAQEQTQPEHLIHQLEPNRNDRGMQIEHAVSEPLTIDLQHALSQPLAEGAAIGVEVIQQSLPLENAAAESYSHKLFEAIAAPVASDNPLANLEFSAETLRKAFEDEYQRAIAGELPSTQPAPHTVAAPFDTVPELVKLQSEPLVLIHAEVISSDPLAFSSVISNDPEALDELLAFTSPSSSSREPEYDDYHQVIAGELQSTQPALDTVTAPFDAVPELLNLQSEPLVLAHAEVLSPDSLASKSLISNDPQAVDKLLASASLPMIAREIEHLAIRRSEQTASPEGDFPETTGEMSETKESSVLEELVQDAIAVLKAQRPGELENLSDWSDKHSLMAA